MLIEQFQICGLGILNFASKGSERGKFVPFLSPETASPLIMVPKGGLEPQETQQPKSFIKRALSCL